MDDGDVVAVGVGDEAYSRSGSHEGECVVEGEVPSHWDLFSF